MEYTKGIWKIHKEVLNSPQPEYIYGGPDNTHICDFRKLNPNLIDEVLEQQQANACLIAAAPDLLTALETMSLIYQDSLIDGKSCNCQRCLDANEKAQATIAKAKKFKN